MNDERPREGFRKLLSRLKRPTFPRSKRFLSWLGTKFNARRKKLRRAANTNAKQVTGAVASNVSQLRESAIEPLPRVDRMPARLRDLEWVGKPSEPVDAAGIVRRLRGSAVERDEHNELGCAYALLAWEHRRDEYWIDAIAALQEASKERRSKAARRAIANLDRISGESPFPVDPLPEDE